MSYIAKDESTEDGAPVMLFEVTIDSVIHRVTNLAYAVTYTTAGASHEWTPAIIIAQENISYSNELGKDTLPIKVAKTSPLAAALLDGSPEGAVTVTIFRAFVGEAETALYWRGVVGDTDADDDGLILACVPEYTKLKRKGLRRLFMTTCDHVLYDPDTCGLSREEYRLDQYVFVCDGARVRINAFVGRNGYWVGGSLIYAGVERTILAHKTSQDGDWLTLSRPIRALTAAVAAAAPNGVQTQLYRGCERTLAACRVRNNKGRFGGWPWRRTRNPFVTSVLT